MDDAPQTHRLGWLEWVSLPGLGIRVVTAKVDTGAKTSSLHAEELRVEAVDGASIARFVVTTRNGVYRCECPVHDERHVRSSSGHEELRIVVQTPCVWNGVRWPIELTLTDRTAMRFPMLLGRRAMAGRFTVDPGVTHLGRKPKRKRQD